ncbi:MAG: ATP-binding protein [Pseudomonadota bacterium]
MVTPAISAKGRPRLADRAISSAAFVKWMQVGFALVNLFVFGMVGFSLHQSYDESQARAAVTGQNLSHLLAQELAGDFDKIDLTLLAAADEAERQLAAGGIDRPLLNAFIARAHARLPNLDALRIADAQGIVAYGSDVAPDSQISVADRPHFVRLRDEPGAGRVISRVQKSRVNHKWVIVLARRINRADGAFAGMVFAAVALDYLTRAFANIDVGRQGSISLRDAELRILARHPLAPEANKVIGEKLAVPALAAVIQNRMDAGGYVSADTVDGVEREFGVRRIPNSPLYMVVGRATGENMAQWRNQAANTAAMVALFFLTTLISSWLIHRNWKHQLAATLELAREEEKFHTVADYTYDWEYWEGPGGEILFMSPSCKRVTGYSPAEFLTQPDLLYRIIHPDDAHLMADHRSDVTAREDAGVDFRIVRRDGEVRWIGHGCRAVFGRDGKFMGRRANNRDITERVQAEATVRQLNAELEQRVARRTAELEAANKELEDFSYSISHDLRTPLRAIAGFARILVDEHAAALDSEGRRLLDVVQVNTVRMGRLVDELLEFLRLGRRPMNFGPVDVAQLVLEIFRELRDSVPDRKLQLVLKNPPPLWGDRTMIRRLLTNLLSNAVKFTQPRPQAVIEVGGEIQGDQVLYYVKDNGVGFDMQYVDKLFQVFERVHPVGQFEGSGTGLAMVRRIVGRHGGRVWADGQVDVGATISFTLPAREVANDSTQ